MLHAKFKIPGSDIDWKFQLSDSVSNSLSVYPVAPFPRNVQIMALLEVPGSYIDRYFQFSDSISNSLRVYLMAPFPRNIQIMAVLWSKHSPHMVLLIASPWVLIKPPGMLYAKYQIHSSFLTDIFTILTW